MNETVDRLAQTMISAMSAEKDVAATMVRAILADLAENPSEAMLNAGREAYHGMFGGASTVFKAMIQEALKE